MVFTRLVAVRPSILSDIFANRILQRFSRRERDVFRRWRLPFVGFKVAANFHTFLLSRVDAFRCRTAVRFSADQGAVEPPFRACAATNSF